MKAYVTLALFIGLTSLSAVGHAAGAKFCMKKYLASLSLHPKASTNFYAVNMKNSNSADTTINQPSVNRHR